jgi:predicted MFS family arabinose efflux permease
MVGYTLFSVPELAVWVGMLIYLYDHGGATAAGLIGGIGLIPAIVLSPVASTIGDRLPRGQALMIGYGSTAVLYVLMTILWWFQAPVWLVAVVFSILEVAISASRPIHYAVVPQLAETPEGLVRANSATIFIASAGMFLGPIVAGVLHDRGGSVAVGVFCAVCLTLAALACSNLRLGAGDQEDSEAGESVTAGIRYVLGEPSVLALVLVYAVIYLAASMLDVLGVTFASSVLGAGAAGQGFLVSAVGLGGLIGALLGSGFASQTKMGRVLALALLGIALPLLCVTAVRSLPLAILMVGISGVAAAVVNLCLDTLLQRTVDDSVLARVFAVSESAMLVGYVVGALATPALVNLVGPAASYSVLALVIAVLAVLLWPQLHRIDLRIVLPTEVLNLLRRIPFLAAMQESSLERLASKATWVDVPDESVVISQGDHGDAFYVIDQGEFVVSTQASGEVARLAEGQGFGELALLRDVPRTATVQAHGAGRLLRVERDDFLAAVTRSQDGHRVAQEVAGAYRDA